jgi:hypothetical protein
MTAGFELVPLSCPQCGAGLAAEAEDVVFYCTACRSGFRFAPGAPRNLERVEAGFVAAPAAEVAGWVPFWLLPARVTVHERSASGGLGRLTGLVSFFLGDRQSTGSDPGEGTFAIPAHHLPLDRTAALAMRFTEELGRSPRFADPLPAERLTGGVYGVDDAQKLAHYTLIASEAEKPDTLKDFRYTIDFGPPRLLGVPWVRVGERRVDAVFGLEV